MSESEAGPLEAVVAFAPGRVNLIGDHTDYTGGLAMPLAIQLGTEVTYLPDRSSTAVVLSSSIELESARIPVSMRDDPLEIAMCLPEWSRYVAGVVATVRPRYGGKGNIVSDLPTGAGLASSASLELAVALAVGYRGHGVKLARLCQHAEYLARGVPTGILDQIAIVAAQEGHAILLDCGSLEIRYVKVPDDVEIVVVHCGVDHSIVASAYSARQAECTAAENEIGPLRSSAPWDVDRISDPIVRRRARHVVSENDRVRAFASAFEHGDLLEAGRLMNSSHRSLAIDFEVSIAELDAVVSWLQGIDGVYGARLTGAGFGGCAVALSRPGTLKDHLSNRRHWIVKPSGGAHLR